MCRIIYITAFLSFFHFTKANPKLEPKVKFSFNNFALNDESGNFCSKVYGVSFVKDRFGNENSACYLQGDFGSYINLGTNNILKPKTGSISIWIKVVHPMQHGKGIESNPILFTRSRDSIDHNEAYYMGYDLTTKNININTTLSREHQVTLYSDSIPKRKWIHVVMTYDNNFLCMYLDGKLKNKITKGFESKFLNGDSVMVGGRYDEKNLRFFNGCIDDIEIYDKVLSLEEINKLYNAPNPNKNAKFINWIIIALLSITFILLITFIIRIRLKNLLKKENEKNELKYKALEFEIRMLKAQMDPHFIFNSLNTILQFIITKENDKAEIYLTKFSKLIRKLLESNTNETICLKDEIDILEKYLEIESLRFDAVFNHTINYSDNISLINTFIPHMLIQPFVENAIWHGLRTKKGLKKLDISFEIINLNTLLCIIEDNGVGREPKINPTEKDKSLALNFISQRLELMSKMYHADYNFNVIDKIDNTGKSLGTKIELKIPINKM